MDTKTPALMQVTFTRIRGNPARRLKVLLRTRGCSHSLRSGGGCVFCGHQEYSARGAPVSGIDIITQFEKSLASFDIVRERIAEVDIYNSGSFLSNNEIPPPAREEIFRLIREAPSIIKVFVESRPEFIINERLHLKKLREMIHDRIFEVGLGLETLRDDIRMNVLNKGFSAADFKRACECLAEIGADIYVYVLLKPPGVSEGEAIRDALDTIYFLDELRRSLKVNVRVSLQPTFVPRNTKLENLYFQGDFTPPKLWSVIEVLRGTFALPIEIQVGLNDEGLASGRVAHNCDFCQKEALDAIERFNEAQDRKFIRDLKCPCRIKWKEEIKSAWGMAQ